MKFGRLKRQHGRLLGLDELCAIILKQCPQVSRIIPGRIKVRKGTLRGFKVQYPTEAGLKCHYHAAGTVQEVFLISSAPEKVSQWLVEQNLVEAES